MITNDTDYKNALTTLRTPITFSTQDISSIMNSSEENYNRQQIYDTLNILYDRIHLLEDVKNYCVTNTYNQINILKTSFKTTLDSIEKNTDSYTDSERSVNLDYSWTNNTVKDRDGLSIEQLNTDLTIDGIATLDLTDFTISHDTVKLPQTLTIGTDNYNASYYSSSATGVVDTVTISLLNNHIINYISCDIINSSVSVSCVTSSGKTVPILLNSYFEPIEVNKIILTCSITNYIPVSTSCNIDKSYETTYTVGNSIETYIANKKNVDMLNSYLNTITNLKDNSSI